MTTASSKVTEPYRQLIAAGCPIEHVLRLVQTHVSAIDGIVTTAGVTKEEKEAAKAELQRFYDAHTNHE